MKKSGCGQKVLAIFVVLVTLLVVNYRVRKIWVSNYNQIFAAFYARDNAKVIELIKSGIDPNSTLVIHTGRKTIIAYYKDVLGLGGSNHDQYVTILGLACNESNVEVCKALLDKGANANLIARGGYSPLSYAIQGDDKSAILDIDQIVSLLLVHNSNANVSGGTALRPFSQAAVRGFDDVAKALIEHGAEINYQEKGGYTALYIAAAEGHTSVIRVLLDAGADPFIPSAVGILPADAALKRKPMRNVAILKDAMAKRKAVTSGTKK
ncbi:MAG: ankyrin repeat domain-containing protein [Chthonomonadales bacterium]